MKTSFSVHELPVVCTTYWRRYQSRQQSAYPQVRAPSGLCYARTNEMDAMAITDKRQHCMYIMLLKWQFLLSFSMWINSISGNIFDLRITVASVILKIASVSYAVSLTICPHRFPIFLRPSLPVRLLCFLHLITGLLCTKLDHTTMPSHALLAVIRTAVLNVVYWLQFDLAD